jgi:hypothetical protein
MYMCIYIFIYVRIHVKGESDDEEGDVENGEKGHFHDGGDFDSSEDTTLEVCFVSLYAFTFILNIYIYACVCSSYIHI